MKHLQVILSVLFAILLSACNQEAKQAKGFSLPEGDPKAGEAVFVQLQCNACHNLPTVAQLSGSESHNISVRLGGEVSHIKTYGELVTSVINPSHRILQSYAPQHTDSEGKSAMRNYNDIMTVTQLVDLVSFLQTQYELRDFERSQYRAYYP